MDIVAGLVSVRFSRISATTPAAKGTAWEVPVRSLQETMPGRVTALGHSACAGGAANYSSMPGLEPPAGWDSTAGADCRAQGTAHLLGCGVSLVASTEDVAARCQQVYTGTVVGPHTLGQPQPLVLLVDSSNCSRCRDSRALQLTWKLIDWKLCSEISPMWQRCKTLRLTCSGHATLQQTPARSSHP